MIGTLKIGDISGGRILSCRRQLNKYRKYNACSYVSTNSHYIYKTLTAHFHTIKILS